MSKLTNSRIIIYILLLIFFTGCGVYIHNFKAVDFNETNKDYTIEAKMYQEILGEIVLAGDVKQIFSLYINKQLVLEVPFQFGKQSFSAKSLYENKQVIIDCYRLSINPEQHSCQVHLDQRKIGSFKLVVDNR